jgi:chemotaxis protein CheD
MSSIPPFGSARGTASGTSPRPGSLASTATALNQGPGPRTERLTRLKSRTPRPGEASFFYFDAHFKSEAVKILPGEYYLSKRNELLVSSTVNY